MDKLPIISSTKKVSTQYEALSHRKYQSLLDESNNKLLDINDSYIQRSLNPAKDTEAKQLSVKLKNLRRKYDKHKRSSSALEKNVQVLQQDLKQCDSFSNSFYSTIGSKQADSLKKQIQKATRQRHIEENNQQVYQHLLDRMRITKVFLKESINKLSEELQMKNTIVVQEKSKKVRAKVRKFRARRALLRLAGVIEDQTLVRQKDLEKLTSDINKVKRAKARKEALRKAQKEDLENALIKEYSSHAEALREKLFLTKLIYVFTAKRFEKEHVSWQMIESAFQQIKVKTGISDIQLIVEKFLTKERKLEELMINVRTKEAQVEQYRNKINDLQNNLSLYEVKDSHVSFLQDSEISVANKTLKDDKEKLNRANFIYQKALVWLQKILERLNKQTREDVPSRVSDSLLGNIHIIREISRNLFKNIKLEKAKVYQQIDAIKRENLQDIIEQIPSSLLQHSKDT